MGMMCQDYSSESQKIANLARIKKSRLIPDHDIKG